MPDLSTLQSAGVVRAQVERCARLRFALTGAFVVTVMLGPAHVSGQSVELAGAGIGSVAGGAALGALTGALAGVSMLTLKANVFDNYVERSVSEGLRGFLPWMIAGASVGAISMTAAEGATLGKAIGPTFRAAVAGVATGAAVGALTAVFTSIGNEELGDELPGGVWSGALIGLGAGAFVGAIETWAGPGEDHSGWGLGAWSGGIAAVPLVYWSVRF